MRIDLTVFYMSSKIEKTPLRSEPHNCLHDQFNHYGGVNLDKKQIDIDHILLFNAGLSY